jgi:uncharacterized protein (DUF488 family)
MKLFTIGYGGRTAAELLDLLKSHGVRTVVDVRLRPDRASMGVFVKSKTPDKGIQKILSEAGLEYQSVVELGNLFLDFEDWENRYRTLLDRCGDLFVARLEALAAPLCLLCAEKRAADCHRRLIADYLARKAGAEVVNIE